MLKPRRWLLAYLLVFVYCVGCGAEAPGKGWFFVQMTDTHWGARDGVYLTRRVVEAVNALEVKVEFVVVTGDVFSDSIRNEKVVADGLDAMKGLKAPVFYVPGNHDLLNTDSARTAKLFEERLGPLNRVEKIRGVTCLFLCTEMMEGEARSPGQVEREWLEQQLESGDRRKPVLIFMHRPPIRDLLNGSDGVVSWDDQYDPRWERLFEAHPEIQAVLAGHFHRDELVWIGGVPVHVAGAVARFWDRQPSFRLYQYKNGRLNFWELYPNRPPGKKKS